MKDIINAIIQGIIQGLTEFLPVSSDGHLSIYQHFSKSVVGEGMGNSMFMTVMLHLGTLIAVFVVFRKKINELLYEAFSMLIDIFKGKFTWRGMSPTRRMVVMLLISLFPLVIVLPFKDFIEGLAEDADIFVEGFCFLFTSVLLFLAVGASGKGSKKNKIGTRDALVIGSFQALAPMPGISRSGSTISSALFCGIDRETAVQFSFIMGIPAILAANILDIKEAVEAKESINLLPLIIGIIIAAIVGFFAIKLIELLIKKNKFIIFAVYTLILGILVICEATFELFAGKNIIEYLAG